MRRQAGLPRISARSDRSAPGARSLRGKPAQPLRPTPSEKPASNPKSVKFSDPISVHFSNPVDKLGSTGTVTSPIRTMIRSPFRGVQTARTSPPGPRGSLLSSRARRG